MLVCCSCVKSAQKLHSGAKPSPELSGVMAPMIKRRAFLNSMVAATSIGLAVAVSPSHRIRAVAQSLLDPQPAAPPQDYTPFVVPDDWAVRLLDAAERQVGETVIYDPSYVRLAYPGGDVPRERGVCTDVVVRAFRDAFSVDLQKLVHEDMRRNFSAYPTYWGAKGPDRNIDHRRVLNLAAYFRRKGAGLPVSQDAADYLPGDIIAQMLRATARIWASSARGQMTATQDP